MEKLLAVQSGLVWILKKDISQETYNTLIQKYTYINPKDDSIFVTYIDLVDRIGVPGGSINKLKDIVGDLNIEDRRISPPFSVKMQSTLALRDYQEVAMQELEEFIKSGGTTFNLSGAPGCVDKDTEFYTRNGWVKISEYNDEEILVYDNDSNTHYEKPSNYIKQPCSTWYNFTQHKGNVLQKLSGEHTVVYKTSKNNIYKKSAEDLYKEKTSIRFISTFNPPKSVGVEYSDNEIRLIVAVAADGSRHNKAKGMFRVNLKKPRKITRFRQLLNSCNVKYKEKIHDDGRVVFYLKHVTEEKTLLQLRDANYEQLKVIADEVFHWDGSIRGKRKSFFTTDKAEADFVQYVLSSTGGYIATISTQDRRGRIKDGKYITNSVDYTVHLTNFKHKRVNPKGLRHGDIIVTNEEPDFKYCFTVSTGMWVSRKNDFICVTGNSGKSFMLANILTRLNTKTLIIAHLSSLTVQLAKEIEEVLGVKPQILTKDTKELSDINIATSQLISKNKDLWYLIKDGIGCLVVDEAESLASMTTMRIFQRAHAKYHIFISATFTRSVDNRTPALVDFAGQKVITLHNDKLITPQVFCVDVDEIFKTPAHNKLFAVARSRFYNQSSLRQKVIRICRASLAKNRQVLVACDLIDMQEKLVQELKDLYGIVAVAVNSSTKVQQRKEALDKFNTGEVQVLIGFGTLNAGLSIPRISTIIRIATPNSPEKLEQLIGRGRREFEGKDGCFVIDLFIKGFNIASRERLYVRKRRLEGWKLFRLSWSTFEEKVLKGF